MASRGRPPLGEAKMSSAERKRRWDSLMRNADGADQARPTRKPVTVYLDEAAISALQVRRKVHQIAELPALTDSTFIEQLLKDSVRRQSPDTPRKQYSPRRHMELLQSIVEELNALEADEAPLRFKLERRHRSSDDDDADADVVPHTKQRLPPTNSDAFEICMAAVRRNARLNAKLASNLAALSSEPKKNREEWQVESKIQGRIEDYLREILDIKGW